ncbi:DUF2213 domain-containing protein [Morganella psychrotolerans]|uniref:DUF2213 domain-containing protein n=1 Tax=Morganella psychrotolerans TaxID=368603 RepID=A0A5M9R9Y8_9GAMM|nr:DUF2213 domain-containing protein [Morganella psychrotolerans]KAA8717421.1 DUF2213 domain-containing protein [Morganella psychrotolerans]OBU08305.1 hypothetical protein AYY16_02900 [Morganella psychrotolerans]
MTKRTYDLNGWLEVKDNPISKVGVFDYLGAEIGAPEPDKIYKVFRPPEELDNEETIQSFRLTPFIVDHEMLGKDATPAEKKGIQGVIGENVYFDHPYLRGNIKIFSDAALSDIGGGKIDLSPGYRSRYDFDNPGVYEGEAYEVVQRHLRGNHLALVDEGRTGADVAVQDHLVITIDTKELIRMSEEDKNKTPTTDEGSFTPEQLEQLKTMIAAAVSAGKPSTDEDPEKKGTTDEDPDPEKEKVAEDAEKAVEDAEAEAEKAESGDPEAVEAAEVAIEAAEEAISEAKDELDKATTDGLNRRLKRLKRGFTTMDEMSSMKRKIARLEKAKPTMDTGALLKQIGERDALAQKLTPFIGVFDHAAMTKQQVAEYGAEKLGVKCDKGTESIAVNAWMQGRTPDSQKPSATMDSAVSNSSILKKWGEK